MIARAPCEESPDARPRRALPRDHPRPLPLAAEPRRAASRRRPTGSRGSTRSAATRSSSPWWSTTGPLADIKIAGTGCSISQSSASLMSAAVKGKPLDEVHRLIRTFKSMMSIHEASLGGDGRTRRRTAEPETVDLHEAGRAGRAAGRRQVPGAHQVRHPELEHPDPGAGRAGDRGELSTGRPDGRLDPSTRRPSRSVGPCFGVPYFGVPYSACRAPGRTTASGWSSAWSTPAPSWRRPSARRGRRSASRPAAGRTPVSVSGGGDVGVVSSLPKTETSICWAAGWSTKSTSPHGVTKPCVIVGSVSVGDGCRVDAVEVLGQPDQVVQRELVVDHDALGDRAQEGVERAAGCTWTWPCRSGPAGTRPGA